MKQTTGSIVVKLVVLAIAATLLFAPFLFQNVRSIEVAARICIFIVLVASYDLLIGYTGIVSFAHPPDIGHEITAGFEFDVAVRFDTDRIHTSVSSFQAGDAPNVPVVELRV